MKHGEQKEQEKQKEQFSFRKIFPQLRPLVLKKEVAEKLGKLMVSDKQRDDSHIPAGYTYFGQFVDHDITRDDTPSLEDTREIDNSPRPVTELIQNRSPSLDLDSVYGAPTAGGDNSPLDDDGVHFSFAETSPVEGGEGHSDKKLPYDIHRGVDIVKIPDNRNDENLAVSQTHALWMRFHNHVADALSASQKVQTDLFIETKNCVIKHYQYIVIHDFIKRFTEDQVFNEIFGSKQNRKIKFFNPIPGESIAMPIEFSGAAYRFGHSLVREKYDWNLNFNAKEGFAANFSVADKNGPNLSLFTFTTAGGFLKDTRPLPSNWIINWANFFDVPSTNNIPSQKAKLIDPFLSSGMGNIPTNSEPLNLAAANLRRSSVLGLPSGQDIADAMGVGALTKKEMVRGLPNSMKGFIQTQGLDIKTPLWFYILQEANAKEGGQTLGEVGSYIICETFYALINQSKPSIIAEDWKPENILEDGTSIDSIPELINFIDKQEPVTNPLEDPRL